jgi:hypothetical protein
MERQAAKGKRAETEKLAVMRKSAAGEKQAVPL